MKRFRQFGLRTILLLTAIVSVLCGLFVARMATVRRFGRTHDEVARVAYDVFIAEPKASSSVGGRSHPARLFTQGRMHISVLDEEEEYFVTVGCRESGVFYGKPVVTIRLDDFLGDRPLDADRNRELADEIIRQLPPDVDVEVRVDTDK